MIYPHEINNLLTYTIVTNILHLIWINQFIKCKYQLSIYSANTAYNFVK